MPWRIRLVLEDGRGKKDWTKRESITIATAAKLTGRALFEILKSIAFEHTNPVLCAECKKKKEAKKCLH